MGRVRSLAVPQVIAHPTSGKPMTRLLRGKILKGRDNGKWYVSVGLYCAGTRPVYCLVHRLVCSAFHGEPTDENPEVNHRNGDKSDNRALNLEWSNRSANNKHSYDHLGRKPPRAALGKFGADNPGSKPVLRSGGGKPDKRYPCGRAVVADGFDPANVSAVCRGKVKTHKGYRWSFAEVTA